MPALADGYGFDEEARNDLADLLVPRILSMHALLKRGFEEGGRPWSRLWQEGHGQICKSHADYAETHLDELRDALFDRG